MVIVLRGAYSSLIYQTAFVGLCPLEFYTPYIGTLVDSVFKDTAGIIHRSGVTGTDSMLLSNVGPKWA
jgi:hypothetical protein